MIKISQIKIPIFKTGSDRETEHKALRSAAARALKCRENDIRKLGIAKKSVDARDTDNILFIYTLNVRLHDSVAGPSAETELAYINKLRSANVSQLSKKRFNVPRLIDGSYPRPVIIGSGPCGLFAALVLTDSGLKPIILERGQDADERLKKTELFFETGKLDPDCNIQFGEGGAGTFSDGKLSTGIKDPEGYIAYCLRRFAEFGADESIIYDSRPHIGTDVLTEVIKNIRAYITSRGGTYIFGARFNGLEQCDGRLKSVSYEEVRTGRTKSIEASHAVLATGHSARDTYEELKALGIPMERKAFAVGVRVQHPQADIDRVLYGDKDIDRKRALLGPASYKLTHTASNGRGIYSFCMCPGGYVINSSSEENRLCVNGMSYNDRGSGMANSALIVTVTPEDYGGEDVLSGIAFQRKLEENAYGSLSGVIPYENYGEFKRHEKDPAGISGFEPAFKGYAGAADVRSMLPDYVGDAICEGMEAFGRRIKGFDAESAIIAGVEARTSSPVRILRGEDGCSLSIKGLYPAGEGAGYAGGITSAAVDGIKAALKIINELQGQI